MDRSTKSSITELISTITLFKNFLYKENRYYVDSTLDKAKSLSLENTKSNNEKSFPKEAELTYDKAPRKRKNNIAEDKTDTKKSSDLSNSYNSNKAYSSIIKKSMEHLKSDAINCTKCPLHSSRQNVVFGSGNNTSPLMIVGEAPGFEEDMKGLPFVGKAGKLLDKMLGAIALSRENCYIANILKCRPPSNRNPHSHEIETCTPFLEKQIELIKPSFIVSLGRFATGHILGTEEGISKLRGKLFTIKGKEYKLLPMYHPAALLRNPSLKKDAWVDLKLLKKLIEDAGLSYIFSNK